MIHIFYHSIDLDGHCSGAIAAHFLANNDTPPVLHPIDHGDEFPWEEIGPTDKVYLLDFSLPPLDMQRLYMTYGVVWIDHHERNINKVKEEIKILVRSYGLQEPGRAACELTWEWFAGKSSTAPLAVTYLGRYDVWDHSHPNTLPFQYGMRACITDPVKESSMKLWNMLFKPNTALVAHICSEGHICKRYQEQQDKRYLELNGFPLRFHGYSCILCNIGKPYASSQVFGDYLKLYDIGIVFALTRHGWVVSLYTENQDIDVARIAEAYGGGGHKSAAGFKCETLPWMQIAACE